MNRTKALKVAIYISRFALAGLWIFAAGAKILMRNDPAENFFKNMPFLVGDRWALPVAITIIVAEIIAAILLLWPRTARLGGIWTAAMLIFFASYALYYRYGLGNAEGLECGCFGGIIGSQLGVTTALRNLVLTIPMLTNESKIPVMRSSEWERVIEGNGSNLRRGLKEFFH